MEPLISAVIPVFNRPRAVCRAAQSVLHQTFRNVELIVVDDGSVEDLGELRALLKEAGARYIRTENRGVSAARNRGIDAATGDWVAFLDSDDIWLPHKLEQLVRFGEQGSWPLVHSDERWIRSGRFVNPKKKHDKACGARAFFQSLELCCISPSAVLIKRELLLALGGFDEDLRACEDYDLWLRVTASDEVGFFPEVLIEKHGGHADQLSRSTPALDRFRVYALLKLLIRAPELQPEKRAAVQAALIQKCAVLATGAEKRGLFERAKLLSSIPGLPLCEETLSRIREELLAARF